MIIGITGKMGSGKSTVANFIQLNHCNNYCFNIKLAQPLYDIQSYIQNLLDLPREKDRELLQLLGTEWGRKKDLNLWLDYWKRVVESRLTQFEDCIVVVDDIRFDNEAQLVKDMKGKIILVDSSPEQRATRINLKNMDHVSERGISDSLVDCVIPNNDSLYDLEKSVKHVLDLWGV